MIIIVTIGYGKTGLEHIKAYHQISADTNRINVGACKPELLASSGAECVENSKTVR